jgi:hypothetical protein
VKDHLRIPDSDHTKDARLIRLLDGSTPVVEFYAGNILVRQYESERYDGGTPFISLRHRPVLSVESVVEYRGPIPYVLTQVPTPDLGTIYSYSFQPSGRIVRRTVGGGITPFPPGLDQVYVSYTAGYTSTPANVREAVLELMRVNFQQTEQGGRPSFGSGGYGRDEEVEGGTVYMGFFVPGRVREMLAPNKRRPSVA